VVPSVVLRNRGGASATTLARPTTTRTNKGTTTTQQQQHQQQADGGKATILTSIFNLANNVAGAGLLTLAAGKATGTGWVPAVITCVALAFGSGHTFGLIGRACEMTDETTFKGLWSRAFDEGTAWLVDSMIFCQTFLASIIYIGLLGDIFSALVVAHNNPSVPSILHRRTGVILSVASCILLPLNMIRDLSTLGFTSILGLVAVLYTVFFITVRALDGTYALGTVGGQAMGKFIAQPESLLALPSFKKSTWFHMDLNSLVLVSNLGLAFIAHYNGPSYWKALKEWTSERFQKVSLRAYAVLALLYTVTMVAGYSTFGDVCQGNILLNYSSRDVLSTLGRFATFFSIIFGFPLVSNGNREGLKNVAAYFGHDAVADPKHHGKLVTVMLTLTTTAAIFLKDIKLIAGLSGAVMGSALVYICPTLVYARIVGKTKGWDSPEYGVARRNLLFIPFGVFTASMGVAMTLKNTILA